MRKPRVGELPFAVAPLCEGDCAALALLHSALFPPGWDEAAFRGFLTDKAVFGFGLCEPALHGFILCRAAADEGEVLTLGVAEAQRRRGAGRALVALAMAEAERRGARHMFLEVGEDNAPARALYESLGFLGVGRRERYYRGGVSGTAAGGAALVLRCELCDLKSQAARGGLPWADERSR